MPLLFNVRQENQFVTITSPAPHLNPTDAVTFECVCTLAKDGTDPTMMARPAGRKWEAPYVVYRLGFYGSTRLPEFQLLFENELQLTTIRSNRAVELERPTHVAGTYDGTTMRLYVNGLIVASIEKPGRLATSEQPTVFATRSSTEPGGLFVGTLQELRIWNIARSSEDINLWKRRLLPMEPAPDGLVGLWEGEPGPPDEIYDHLTSEGWSQWEVFLVHFVNWYSYQYNQRPRIILTDIARSYFPDTIQTMIFVKARDGYFAIYEPEFPQYLERAGMLSTSDPREGMLIYDRSDQTVSEVIQSWTGNRLRVLVPTLGNKLEDAWVSPPDVSEAADETINPAILEVNMELQNIAISPVVSVEDGIVTGLSSQRIRAISPLITLPDGSLTRQFTWLFVDFWFGDLAREQVHLPMTLRFLEADLQALQWAIDLALPPQQMVDGGPTKAIDSMSQLVRDFEELLDRPGVDEVQDIQPFLTEPRNWILLSPSCKKAWPQKMLGNKYKVDFVVQESDDSYTAIEIESPSFPLFTKALDPSYRLTHAEEQARNYCNYIDMNRDTVEREEGLAGIFRPRGLVVIGRRRSLSPEATKKLVARNADAGRYTVMVYDDLIDRMRAVIDAVKRALSG